MCDSVQIRIINQEDVEFYKKCPVIGGTKLSDTKLRVSSDFEGPFNLPGVKSLGSSHDTPPKASDKPKSSDSKSAADKLYFGPLYGYVALTFLLPVLSL